MSIHLRATIFISLYSLCLAILLSSHPALAEEESFQLSPNAQRPECLPEWIAPPQKIPNEASQNTATANEVFQKTTNDYTLFGNVVIEQPGTVVLSNKVDINRLKQTADAFGQVQLHRKDLILTGTTAFINQKDKTAKIADVSYQFTNSRAHGTANTIDLNQNDRLANLDNASYTTCRLLDFSWKNRLNQTQTGKKYDWKLNFSHLRIDDAKRRIYGHNAVLYFQKVPVFYSPYINFPMDKRASGLLFPQFGTRQSILQTKPETYLTLPYYFNIAPEVDDTLSITAMDRRGLILGNEFRYLQPNHSATLTTHFLNDNIAANQGLAYLDSTGTLQYTDPIKQRWDAKLEAGQHWAPGLDSNILWREVSDENVYTDLPIEPALDTASYTERHIKLTYQHEDFNSHITALDYLRLRKNAPYNYEKRPEVGLNYSHYFNRGALNHFGTDIRAEATEFEVSYAADHGRPEALRTYVSPSINYTLLKPYGHLKTEVIANKVHYRMQNNGYNTTGADEHDVTVPQFALNGGLVFERNLAFNDHELIQTLEPQIQYLFVPYQDQSNIPIFDTGVKSLDFTNLFAYNRFSGYDRIGDANQVSAALTTRFLKADGTPVAEAGLGQIFYLADRKVQLSGNTPSTNKVSDYFVKLGFTANRFTFASTSQYSYRNYELTNANSRLKLDLTPRFKFLLTDTILNNNLPGEKEDLAAGFNWHINHKWTLGSYWNYDFTANRKTEVNSAIRYDSCCWASELSVKEAQLASGLYNYSVQYVIEFKGLSSVGTPFKKYLTDKLNF